MSETFCSHCGTSDYIGCECFPPGSSANEDIWPVEEGPKAFCIWWGELITKCECSSCEILRTPRPEPEPRQP